MSVRAWHANYRIGLLQVHVGENKEQEKQGLRSLTK